MLERRLIYNQDTFTSDKGVENLASDKYIHKLIIGLQGEATAATIVEGEDLLTYINSLDVMMNGSPVIQLTGFELYAINRLLGIGAPFVYDSSAATDDEAKVMGLVCPLSFPSADVGSYTFKIDWATLSGSDTSKITIAEEMCDEALETGYYHMVRLPYTLRGATGYGNTIDLPQPGDLVGIILYNNDPPQEGDEDSSIEEIRIRVDGVQKMEMTWEDIKQDFTTMPTDAQQNSLDLKDCYALIDLRKSPIPKDRAVKIDMKAGIASQSIVIIPIYKVA